MKHKSFDFLNNSKIYHKLLYFFVRFCSNFCLTLISLTSSNKKINKYENESNIHTSYIQHLRKKKLKSNQIFCRTIFCCCCCCLALADCFLFGVFSAVCLEIVFNVVCWVRKETQKKKIYIIIRKTVWYRIFV